MRKKTYNALCVLLVGVLGVGVCCMGYASRNEDGKWFGNSSPSTWHWKDKDAKPDNNDENEHTGNDHSNNQGENKPDNSILEGSTGVVLPSLRMVSKVNPDIRWELSPNNLTPVLDYVLFTQDVDGSVLTTGATLGTMSYAYGSNYVQKSISYSLGDMVTSEAFIEKYGEYNGDNVFTQVKVMATSSYVEALFQADKSYENVAIKSFEPNQYYVMGDDSLCFKDILVTKWVDTGYRFSNSDLINYLKAHNNDVMLKIQINVCYSEPSNILCSSDYSIRFSASSLNV